MGGRSAPRPSFRRGIPGGVRRRGGAGPGRGPPTAYKRGGHTLAPVIRLRALCGPRYHGPCPPARVAAAPRGRPRRLCRVGRCLEIPGGGGDGPVPPLFLGAWDRGARGGRASPNWTPRPGKLAGNLALGSRGGAGPGWLPRANVRLSLLLFPPPLASAPPRATGSDVTKPVSPLLSPHSRPSLVILGQAPSPGSPCSPSVSGWSGGSRILRGLGTRGLLVLGRGRGARLCGGGACFTHQGVKN